MTVSQPGTAEENSPGKRPNSGLITSKESPNVVDSDAHTNSSHSELEALRPVSFFSLFRFTTNAEFFFNFIGLICAAVAGTAQSSMTLLFGNLTQQFVTFAIVDNRVKSGDPQAVASLSVAAASLRKTAGKDASYLVYIGIGSFLCIFVYMYTWVHTAEVNAKRIRELYLKAVLRQDIQFFDKVGPGEVATRIQTDTHLVQQGMSEKVAIIVHFIATFFSGFAIAYAKNWRLALALSSIMPCIATGGAVMNGTVMKYMQLSLNYVAEGGNLAEEVISTVRTTQAFGNQSVMVQRYGAQVERSRNAEYKAAVWQGGGLSFLFFVMYSSYALAFYFGTILLNGGHATAGQIVNVFLAVLIGSMSLAMIPPEMQAIIKAQGAAAKLFSTIDRVPAIDSADPSGLKLDNVNGEIAFEDVHFNYPARPTVQILKGISIQFRAGKTAALVGASGSGKSTIVSLAERFYDPLSGIVKLDGIDLKKLNLKWLRSQIGLVSQEPTLFATTIKENVAHGLVGTQYENASEEKKFDMIKDACLKANADGFISKLPLGYETMVGERGFLLSGGQKQRVAIARAIVSDPRILLLDEATSALDTQSEGVVQDALDKASAGRTTITIAHRLSTVKNADVIYVMGDGLVIEQGTHDELIALNGAYSRLVHAQRLRERNLDDMDDDVEDESGKEENDMEKLAQDEVPLGRRNTGSHSLASEILEQKRQDQEMNKTKPDYSMTYLFYRLGDLNREGWNLYIIGFVFAIMNGLVYPSIGVVFARGIEAFSLPTIKERRTQGDRNGLWFFVIAIIASVVFGNQVHLFHRAAAVLTSKLRTLSFQAILRQDIEFYDKDENNSGSLTASLSDNPQRVNGLVGATLGAIVQSITTLVAGWILGLIFGWKLALVAISCTPLLVTAGYIRLRVVVLKDKANKKAHDSSAQLACEAAGAIRTVASLTREDDCCHQYAYSLEEPLRRSDRTAVWSNAIYAVSQSMIFFVIALVFYYGAVLFSHQELTSFKFFVCLMSTVMGSIQAGNVFNFVPDISSARSAGFDIIELIDSVPEIDAESVEGKRIGSLDTRGHIRFENVHFRYPTRPGVRVLRDLSLQAEPGTYVALVGASGCGKSTVIQMLERFYDPLAGEIFLDGHPISEYNVQDYRKEIALVSQEPTLYAGTVRFNVLLGAIKPDSEVTQEEIEKACRDANILEFIQSLPNGFDTEVGGKGSQLSGGQKQRIAIARALLRNPKVLLLDEATSALDSTSEKVVQAALDQAIKGRTTIAIAHRLSTIQNADRIYFLKEGRVSESGTHDQLLEKRGDYYEYVQLQALNRRE